MRLNGASRLWPWIVVGLLAAVPARGERVVRTGGECRIAPVAPGADPRPTVCMDAFIDVLWDHGTWVETDRYGHLFCPSVQSFGPDFRPFTDGHFVMTPEGWNFVGKHPMSWVTDHYGRWVQTGVPACRWGWSRAMRAARSTRC